MKENDVSRVDLPPQSRGQDLPRKPQPDSSQRQSRCRAIRRDLREGRIASWDDVMWMLEELEAL